MSSSASLEASATPPTLKMSSRQLLNVSSLSKHSAAAGGGGTPLLVADARRRLHLASASRLAVHQLLGSLALLCLLSLLMAFLALFFLQRVASAGPQNSDSPEEHLALYQVAVAMSTLTISLNLCCLFVCCIQFLLGVKLLRTPNGLDRTNMFIKRSSHTRVLAIAGFFLSIPVFFTGVILFTFIHFHELPAIVTSVVIGLGIVFCGVASVHNVYLWQWEKTCATRELVESRALGVQPDLTHTLELSTLV
ncbi:uncharacterized protein [Dermacentor andersoni]|uniref:uncharacterized protein n=1 Tax=Dermacentor andersoni TaxID=34620 RepID=UPI00215585D9|nr:uncharacterized protein LOC126542467 [Dermacentor andersoni]XP_050045505.1 uncharacterized protein LOC126542467 [Dermacentor andersoni]